MSSHREAPEIAKDPVADSTDVYAFVSPDRPDTVTLIANYIPFQAPDGGPNFYEFGDDVAYDIHVSNKGKGEADITYRFQFHTEVRNPKTFLYNTGQITSLGRPDLEPAAVLLGDPDQGRQGQGARRRSWPARRSTSARAARRTTPTSPPQAVHKVGRRRVFAGQRADAFHVDLGSIFDLGALRPFQHLHLIPSADAAGRELAAGASTCTRSRSRCRSRRSRAAATADQPGEPRRGHRRLGVGEPPQVADVRPRHGVRTSATGRGSRSRGWATRCSTRSSCRWRRRTPGTPTGPRATASFAKYVNHPELAKLLPVLYPGVFPNLAALPQGAGGPERDPADRHPVGRRARASRTSPGRSSRTCCGSTWRSRRQPAPTTWAWSPATRRASRTDAASTTTW